MTRATVTRPSSSPPNHGAEDAYPANTGGNLNLTQCLAGFEFPPGTPETPPPGTGSNKAVMSYYDGNTVTGLWNYAQRFAMSDNSYSTTYGPSTPGALNVTAAQTDGAICGPTSATINDSPCPNPPGLDTSNPADSNITAGSAQPAGPGTTYSDADPTYDICSYLPGSDGGDGGTAAGTITMGGNNIGTELLPEGAEYQDGHAGYSDPLDEQTWLINTINALESLRTWKSTAIVIAYDDSDGWYDHQLGTVLSQSQTSLDALTGTGMCGSMASQVPVNSANQPEQGKCGLGDRQPLLVISPWARTNFVDHTLTDQSSVVKFIEYNWNLPAMGNGAADTAAGSLVSMFDFNGRPHLKALYLDPTTGEPINYGTYLRHFKKQM